MIGNALAEVGLGKEGPIVSSPLVRLVVADSVRGAQMVDPETLEDSDRRKML